MEETRASQQSPTDGLTLLGAGATEYPTHPDRARLETFPNPHPGRHYTVTFDCPEFTSVCPLTKQPDFAHIVITYHPGERCLESKSLKLYLGAFRNTGMFHEGIVNRIAADIEKALWPDALRVEGKMNARGGISINVMAYGGKDPTLLLRH
jgi:7-cyano-7-deazaguanine reductase